MPEQIPGKNPYAPPAAANEFPVQVPASLGAEMFSPYREMRGVATVTKVFLYINAVVAALSFIVEAGLASGLGKIETGNVYFVAYASLAILTLVLLVGSAIPYGIWFHHVYANVPALSGETTAFSPGWAPGSFFVPILNLGRPYTIAREIWRKSDTDSIASNWGIVKAWWTLWLAENILSTIGSKMTNSGELLSTGLWFVAFSEILTVGAAITAATVVDQITKRQTKQARALGIRT